MRVPNHFSGNIGSLARFSTRTKNTKATTPSIATRIVRVAKNPHAGPRLIANKIITEPAPSNNAPFTSNFTFARRSVSLSSHQATTHPIKHSGACIKKIVRHPNSATSGTPATTPITGAPAVTKLQYPNGLTLSLGSNMRLIYAIAAGPSAEPPAAESVRKIIIDVAFHANAVLRAKIPATNNPQTKTRLCPHKSPTLPNAGPTTPNANIGAVIAQLMIPVVLFKSSATVLSETTNSVIMKLTVNTQLSNTIRVALRRETPTRCTSLRRSNNDHGITETSSTPPLSRTLKSEAFSSLSKLTERPCRLQNHARPCRHF